MVALWKQVIAQVNPNLVITTGTAGGVGEDTLLGDVIVARHVRWDCTKTFAALRSRTTSTQQSSSRRASSTRPPRSDPDQRLPPPPSHRKPYMWRDTAHPRRSAPRDFFAFDDAQDYYGLRTYDPQARAVEMDDAALGLASATMDRPPGSVSATPRTPR